MERKRCVACGNNIMKSALLDPYLCRECSREEGRRYRYLDEGVVV
ncbi:MAG TPA: hypothetical protein VJC16_04585 [Candidatus Nanoarchaeia archaeon]|nr:hypothetical protein [Candidatus Nanoarchaeia archaeon]